MELKSIEFKLKKSQNLLERLKKYKEEFLKRYGGIDNLSYEDLEEDERLKELMDLLILNYSKVQSIIGEKLFKEVLEYAGIDINKKFVEILVILEREGILNNVYEWSEIRELRNSFSHEYPEEFEEMMANLSLLLENIDKLQEVYNNVKKYYIETKKVLDESRNT